jgi:hypothetical protein
MMSSRFAPAMCVLVALALVPAVMHSYVGATAIDGRSTARIPAQLAGFTSTPSTRHAGWGQDKFESDDWIERTYADGRNELVLTVVRSFDLKRLYHHPELSVAYGTPFVKYESTRVGGAPDVPVHVLRTGNGEGSGIALYALHYGNEFIEQPLLFQIRTAGEMLIAPRKAMTLFFVQEPGARGDADISTLASKRLLFAAIEQFLAQPAAGAR